MRGTIVTLCLLVSACIGLIGCQHIGPGTIMQDRLAYNRALDITWKEQVLLNIVRIRYVDTPVFVDVAQIVSGYSHTGSVGSTFSASVIPNAVPSIFDPLLGAMNLQQGFGDTPTISYAPQTSSKFIQNLTLPMPPNSILYLMQAGYPVDLIFDLMVDSINGLRGKIVTAGLVIPPTPEFQRVVQVLRKAQLSGSVSMFIEVSKDKKDESLVMMIRDPDTDPELLAELAEVRKLMRIKPDQKSFRVVFGNQAGGPNEIALATRSPYRILQNLSASVEAPAHHIAEGRAPNLNLTVDPGNHRLMVLSGPTKPCDAYAAVCYRDTWFWINDNDLESKRTMLSLSILLALADTGSKENVPFLTISTR
ncbi:MAG TPA: hypothetical protein PLN21_20875 [Gemmatales bacterium]|nr:hypothetical protein [Gemmatales bacterium]